MATIEEERVRWDWQPLLALLGGGMRGRTSVVVICGGSGSHRYLKGLCFCRGRSNSVGGEVTGDKRQLLLQRRQPRMR